MRRNDSTVDDHMANATSRPSNGMRDAVSTRVDGRPSDDMMRVARGGGARSGDARCEGGRGGNE